MHLSILIALATIWACNRIFCMVLQVKPRPHRDPKERDRGSRHRHLEISDDYWAASGGGGGGTPSSGDAVVCRRFEHKKGVLSVGDGGACVPATPSREQLQDPLWVAAIVHELNRATPAQAIEFFRNALAAGTRFANISGQATEKLFLTLVGAAVHIGRPQDAVILMQDCRTHTSGIPVSLLSSVVKLCTENRYFKEALAIFNLVGEDRTTVIDDKSVWSCVLLCAVELHLFARCNLFFQRLKGLGRPSQEDYGNIIRVASAQADWLWCLTLIEEMRKYGVEIDSEVYRAVLSTCVAASQNDQAKAILHEMEYSGCVVDVTNYNTLAKAYSKAGQIDRCFELVEHMQSNGVPSSPVTYGILLDCCISKRQFDKAAEVFDVMRGEGVVSAELYIVMIRGFARAEEVDKAMRVYEQMKDDAGARPDGSTLSILMKAVVDAGHIDSSLQLLETMIELGFTPDEVVFNSLLKACIETADGDTGRRVYIGMVAASLHDSIVQRGLRPSKTTFSIILRIFIAGRRLEEAVEMLRVAPTAWGIKPESRSYMQLAQTCLCECQGRRAVAVYAIMLSRAMPTTANILITKSVKYAEMSL